MRVHINYKDNARISKYSAFGIRLFEAPTQREIN